MKFKQPRKDSEMGCRQKLFLDHNRISLSKLENYTFLKSILSPSSQSIWGWEGNLNNVFSQIAFNLILSSNQSRLSFTAISTEFEKRKGGATHNRMRHKVTCEIGFMNYQGWAMVLVVLLKYTLQKSFTEIDTQRRNNHNAISLLAQVLQKDEPKARVNVGMLSLRCVSLAGSEGEEKWKWDTERYKVVLCDLWLCWLVL